LTKELKPCSEKKRKKKRKRKRKGMLYGGKRILMKPVML
jgi:hypothetical protein